MAVPNRFGRRRNVSNMGGFARPAGSRALSTRMSRGQMLRAMGIGAAGLAAASMGFGGVAKAATWQEYACGVTSYPLTAGQTIKAGNVIIGNDGEFLYVEYSVTGDWCITETHLWVGTDLATLPKNRQGILVPGQFPYKSDTLNPMNYTITMLPSPDAECVTKHLYKIPLSQLSMTQPCNVQQLYVVPHAAIRRPLNNCTENSIVYGINRYDPYTRTGGELFEIDVNSGASSMLYQIVPPPPLSAVGPNGLAYDPYNKRLYYCDYDNYVNDTSTLYFWNGVGQVTAGSLLFDATGAPIENIAAADFYTGRYYFIAGDYTSIPGSATDKLYYVEFNADGTMLGLPHLVANISNSAHGWTFDGDIAIKDGFVYGWGKCHKHGRYEFFKYDLTSGGFTYLYPPNYSMSLQLAFGSDGTLIGHSYNEGTFYKVDLDSGWVTPYPTTPNLPNHYTDIASGALCVPQYQNETAFGGNMPGSTTRWWFYDTYLVKCCQTQCQTETAWGGDTPFLVHEPGAWWYLFDTSVAPTQTIHAGQVIPVGTVTVSRPVNGYTTLTIQLTGGWELQPVNEAVKIQAYDQFPGTERPAAGLFTTYKGNELVVTVRWVPYYAIHLDVQNCQLQQ